MLSAGSRAAPPCWQRKRPTQQGQGARTLALLMTHRGLCPHGPVPVPLRGAVTPGGCGTSARACSPPHGEHGHRADGESCNRALSEVTGGAPRLFWGTPGGRGGARGAVPGPSAPPQRPPAQRRRCPSARARPPQASQPNLPHGCPPRPAPPADQ